MSAGHDHYTPSRLAHSHGLAALLRSGGAPAIMRRFHGIDVDHDVPLASGYNVAGTVVYVDRDLVRCLFETSFAEKLLGQRIDTGLSPEDALQALWWHEKVEKTLIDSNNPIHDYNTAHMYATAAEHDRVREMGSTPVRYERALEPIIQYCLTKKLKDVPKDLSCAPLLEHDLPKDQSQKLIDELHRLGVKDADRVSRQSVNYGRAYGEDRCDACSMWQGARNAALATCSLVEGLVRGEMTCDEWASTSSRSQQQSERPVEQPTGRSASKGEPGDTLNGAENPAEKSNPPEFNGPNPDKAPQASDNAEKSDGSMSGISGHMDGADGTDTSKTPATISDGARTVRNKGTGAEGQRPPAEASEGQQGTAKDRADKSGEENSLNVVHSAPENASGARKILLARHGATALNNEDNSVDRIRGSKDIPLSAEGRAEAERLAAKIAKDPPDVIVASDLSRAADTAKIIADKCGMKVAELSETLRPWKLGYLTGMVTKEALPKMAKFVEHPDKPVPAGNGEPMGESFNSFLRRYLDGVHDILNKYEGTILFVAHHRNERAMFAWKAAGFPADGHVDVAVFSKKGEAPGAVCPMEIPLQAIDQYERSNPGGKLHQVGNQASRPGEGASQGARDLNPRANGAGQPQQRPVAAGSGQARTAPDRRRPA